MHLILVSGILLSSYLHRTDLHVKGLSGKVPRDCELFFKH